MSYVSLSGTSTDNVLNYQRSLAALSVATGDTQLNVAATGTIDFNTVWASFWAAKFLQEHIPELGSFLSGLQSKLGVDISFAKSYAGKMIAEAAWEDAVPDNVKATVVATIQSIIDNQITSKILAVVALLQKQKSSVTVNAPSPGTTGLRTNLNLSKLSTAPISKVSSSPISGKAVLLIGAAIAAAMLL